LSSYKPVRSSNRNPQKEGQQVVTLTVANGRIAASFANSVFSISTVVKPGHTQVPSLKVRASHGGSGPHLIPASSGLLLKVGPTCFPWWMWAPSNIGFLGLTQVYTPSDISIGSICFCKRHQWQFGRQTYRHTDIPRYISNSRPHLMLRIAMRPSSNDAPYPIGRLRYATRLERYKLSTSTRSELSFHVSQHRRSCLSSAGHVTGCSLVT